MADRYAVAEPRGAGSDAAIGETPRGITIFRAADAEPNLSVFDVAAHPRRLSDTVSNPAPATVVIWTCRIPVCALKMFRFTTLSGRHARRTVCHARTKNASGIMTGLIVSAIDVKVLPRNLCGLHLLEISSHAKGAGASPARRSEGAAPHPRGDSRNSARNAAG